MAKADVIGHEARRVLASAALALAFFAAIATTTATATETIENIGRSARSVLAFPGAEGHGRFSLGGRGGRVVIVDTLEDVVSEDDAYVSLREALEVMEGPRTVVFDVGGTFDTGLETIVMSGEEDSRVTVACQSAPAPGVLIRGDGIRIRGGVHDIVMRHCAIRNRDPGGEAAENSRGVAVIGTSGVSAAMIFDHLSVSWATDENFTVFVGPDATADLLDVTLSRSIIAEGDSDSDHPESGQLPDRYLHAMGPSCNSSSEHYRILGCSIVGNLIAHNARRNPLMWGVSGEVLNNVIYNWHETALDARPHKPERVDLHVSGNRFVSGPTSKAGNPPMRLVEEPGMISRFDVHDNIYINAGRRLALDDLTLGTPDLPANEAAPFDLGCVGASIPQRDSVDQRVIDEYLAGKGGVGIGDDEIRHYADRKPVQRPRDHDVDRDGMADTWERRRGLDNHDPDDHSDDSDDDGYTNIEEYLAELARC